MIGTGPDKRPNDQAVAICLDVWREDKKSHTTKEVPAADDPEESEEEFLDRCVDEVLGDNPDMDEDEAGELCQLSWDERKSPEVIHKTHAETNSGMEFILSDETPDRLGDVIMASGWQLDNFMRNPVALFNHTPSFVIGKWSNLKVINKELRGHLELAPAGTSERIDEIRKLVDAGILRAVSVGFRSIESKPIKSDDPWGGQTFVKHELVETSLVSVPANPNALAVAKQLNISAQTMDLVFATHGNGSKVRKRRGFHGTHADLKHQRKTAIMSSLSERIQDAQTRRNAVADELLAHLDSLDDTNVSDTQMEKTDELNAKLAQIDKTLAALEQSEKLVAATTRQPNGDGGTAHHHLVPARIPNVSSPARPFSVPAKKVDPIDWMARSGTIMMYAHLKKISVDQAIAAISKHYPAYGDEPTRAFCEYVARAASAPAMTTVSGWASQLVQTTYAAFMETLMPKSVYPRLASLGLSLSFGNSGIISIPTRNRTPTIAGSFIGEGAAIPVRQGQFAAQLLYPKKMGVICTFSREMNEHSVPQIEGLLRQGIQEDTAVSLDTVLLDINPATTIRPAGILNGVAALTATAGGGLTALLGDLKALSGALITGTAGHIRSPAWIMNPQQALSASLAAAPNTGVFPFKDEVSQGRLLTWPIIDSGTVPLGTVIAVDAADFVSVGGEAPRFEVSDQATLHEEDTAPLPLVGATGAVAAPQRSLFQTDSLALRLILPINWTLRRTGVVAWTQAVTW